MNNNSIVKYNSLESDTLPGIALPKRDTTLINTNVRLIGNKNYTVMCKDPIFSSEQELLDFLKANNIKINDNDINNINLLHIAIALAVGLLSGYLIFK